MTAAAEIDARRRTRRADQASESDHADFVSRSRVYRLAQNKARAVRQRQRRTGADEHAHAARY
jgi:hypothetical protein